MINILISMFVIIMLIIFPQQLITVASSTTNMWISKVFPVLFPFMTCCSIIMNSQWSNNKVNKNNSKNILLLMNRWFMNKFFKLPSVCIMPLVLGALSGYPMGAKITADLYNSNKINYYDAIHTLYFVNNAGPLFIIGTVATNFYNDTGVGYIMLLSCFLGSISLGVLYGVFKKNKSDNKNKDYRNNNKNEYKNKNKNDIKINKNKNNISKNNLERSNKVNKKMNIKNNSFFDILNQAIGNSLLTVCNIGGYMVIFSVFIKGLEVIGVLDLYANAINLLPFLNLDVDIIKGFTVGIMEMTTGIYNLSIIENNLFVRFIATCFILSFGGCSILGQTFGIIKSIPINKLHYIYFKIIHGFLSSIYFICIYNIFKLNVTVFNYENSLNVGIFINNYINFSLFISLLFLFLYVLKIKK